MAKRMTKAQVETLSKKIKAGKMTKKDWAAVEKFLTKTFVKVKAEAKRRAVAIAKKKAIMSSEAFREWWKWRRHIRPIPADPYRAFMIDIALYARVHHKEVWKRRTNWMDYPPVDLPKGAPAPKRRLPPRKHIKRFKRMPKAARRIPYTKPEKRIVKEIRTMEEKYHLPPTDIVFQLQHPLKSKAAYTPAIFGKGIITLSKTYVAEAEKKGVTAMLQPVATALHEAGHHAHYAYGGTEKLAVPSPIRSIITQPLETFGAGRIQAERIAWQIAKKFKAKRWKPQMAWVKKWSLGTYLGTTPREKIREVEAGTYIFS